MVPHWKLLSGGSLGLCWLLGYLGFALLQKESPGLWISAGCFMLVGVGFALEFMLAECRRLAVGGGLGLYAISIILWGVVLDQNPLNRDKTLIDAARFITIPAFLIYGAGAWSSGIFSKVPLGFLAGSVLGACLVMVGWMTEDLKAINVLWTLGTLMKLGTLGYAVHHDAASSATQDPFKPNYGSA